MEFEVDEKELKAAGAELLPDGRRGLRLHGWEIESIKRPILNTRQLQEYSLSLSLSIVCVRMYDQRASMFVRNRNQCYCEHIIDDSDVFCLSIFVKAKSQQSQITSGLPHTGVCSVCGAHVCCERLDKCVYSSHKIVVKDTVRARAN